MSAVTYPSRDDIGFLGCRLCRLPLPLPRLIAIRQDDYDDDSNADVGRPAGYVRREKRTTSTTTSTANAVILSKKTTNKACTQLRDSPARFTKPSMPSLCGRATQPHRRLRRTTNGTFACIPIRHWHSFVRRIDRQPTDRPIRPT